MKQRFIGLMSGTSLDGVDAVLLCRDQQGAVRVEGDVALPYPAPLIRSVLALQTVGDNELDRAECLANELSRLYAVAVAQLLARLDLPREAVRAIGCHGQTIRHAPDRGYTIQLANLPLLAELTGITVIGDFRRRDVAAGGQGAPLVPAFHAAVFGDPLETRAILNLGGIANWSLLHPDGTTGGFDSGPANMLLDAWIQRHQGVHYDADGRWAASGTVVPALLERFCREPFFRKSPPKSTGRDLFDLNWLDAHLAALPTLAPADVQATLAELTAWSAADALRATAPQTRQVYVCGGGARNSDMLRRLSRHLGERHIATTEALGLPVHQVEAAAFAWLAARCLDGLPGNVPTATGAAGPRILGAIHPA